MFDTLASKVTQDKGLPLRAWRLDVLRRVLDGELYNVLTHEFHEEKTDGNEYVPLRKRKPSVRYNLSRIVVQDSIALLFGEGHFPAVRLADQDQAQKLAALLKSAKLPQVMSEAAMIGSVGSVAVLLRVLDGRVFFDAMATRFLTPRWEPKAPDTLLDVTELYSVEGRALRDQGYTIAEDDLGSRFWFRRVWDTQAERWFVPVKRKDGEQPTWTEDKDNTVEHGLGFVPMVWIKNLPGGDKIDGCCTFRAAIEDQIEIDYQLSQGGRGLKYSSDPLLLIKEPASPDSQFVRSASNALIVEEKGDAKLLEINGSAVSAVIEYVKALREMALESVHGNRSNADKLSAAQSGRALELLHQPLIWLADELRTSYGENGVLPLVRMVMEASRKIPLRTLTEKIPKFAEDEPTLKWPPWFIPTGQDKTAEATALKTLGDSGHISRETAVTSIAPLFDVEDVDEEMMCIAADEMAADQRATAMAAQVKATETLPE